MVSPSTDKGNTEEKGLKRRWPQSPNDRAVRQKIAEPDLTPDRITQQLAQGLTLTADVLNLLSNAIKLKYWDKQEDVLVLHPLWFRNDDHSVDLPQPVSSIKDSAVTYFAIHNPGDNWALGALRPTPEGFNFCYHDSWPVHGQFHEDVGRLRAWMDETGHKGRKLVPFYYRRPKRSDGWNCGVYMLVLLRRLLLRESLGDAVDFKAEKASLIELSGTIKADEGASSQDEVVIGEPASVDHQPSLVTLDVLEQSLAAAKTRHQQAKDAQRQALLHLGTLSGRLKAREELRQNIKGPLQIMRNDLGARAADISGKFTRMRSDLASRQKSQVASPEIDPSGCVQELFDEIEQNNLLDTEELLIRDHGLFRLGAHWLANRLKSTGETLEDDITAAEKELSAAEAGLKAALSEVQRCRTAVLARKIQDAVALLARETLGLFSLS